MSSWIINKAIPTKKAVVIKNYHDTSHVNDIMGLYLELFGAYVFYKKMGETCNVWDSTSVITTTLRPNPLMKLLKEKPTESKMSSPKDYKECVGLMKFNDIRKMAQEIIRFQPQFQQTLQRFLEKAGIKTSFDFGIQLVKESMSQHVELIKTYQKKSKKSSLSIYVMANTYSDVVQFQSLCDPSWKITSLSKNATNENDNKFIRTMAEIQIMTALPALILDFEKPTNRFIYLMQQELPGLQYFVELKSRKWELLGVTEIVSVALPPPAPLAPPTKITLPVIAEETKSSSA
jgi:hypothetical protein